MMESCPPELVEMVGELDALGDWMDSHKNGTILLKENFCTLFWV
jgi:hypothetical protein